MSLIRGQQDALSLHLNSKLKLIIQAATDSGYQSIYELTVTHMSTGSRGVQFELDNKESLTSLIAVIC